MARVFSEQEEVVVKHYVDFYCDSCGKHIGRVEEGDDGYIPLPTEAYEFVPYLYGFEEAIEGKKMAICGDCYDKKYKEAKEWFGTFFNCRKEERR